MDRLSVQCQSPSCSVRPVYTSFGTDKKPMLRAWNTRVILEIRKEQRNQEHTGLAIIREVYEHANSGALLSESLIKKIGAYLSNNVHMRKTRKTNV